MADDSKCKRCRYTLGYDEGWGDQLCDACHLDDESDAAEREHDLEDEERGRAEMAADDEETRAEDAARDAACAQDWGDSAG